MSYNCGEYLKLEGKPTDNELGEYIPTEHKFRLKINGVKKRLGSTFFEELDNPEIKLLLNEIKDKMYLHVKSESRRENYDVIEYRIAKMNWREQYQARDDMLEAQLALVKYALSSGGDQMGDHHGVNLKQSTVILDFDKIRKKLEVSTSVDRILRDGDQPLIMVPRLIYRVDPLDYRSDY